MSALPHTPRRTCELCQRRMEPRKSESKYGYLRRRFCSDRCANEWTRRNRGDVASTLARVMWEGAKR